MSTFKHLRSSVACRGHSARLGLDVLEDRCLLSTSVSFTVTSDWGSGFGTNVAITNTGTTPISGWKLEFNFAASINEHWNTKVLSHVGSHYVLQDAGYNSLIAPNG